MRWMSAACAPAARNKAASRERSPCCLISRWAYSGRKVTAAPPPGARRSVSVSSLVTEQVLIS